MAVTNAIPMGEEWSAPAATWSLRLAFFSVGLLAVALVLHRLLGLPTPILLNTFAVSVAGAALAAVLALAAMVHVWVSGRRGFGLALVGLFVSLGVLALPVTAFMFARQLPPINDVSTDFTTPPQLVALARERASGANDPAYPGATFAALQSAAYPDLLPVRIDRSVEEAFELAAEAVRRLKFHIVSETPPEQDTAGLIEAVDRTLVIGFEDDVVIRVIGDQHRAQVDIRSASRYGSHDFGRNAARVRDVIRELHARVESTVPAAPGSRTVRAKAKDGKTPLSKRLSTGDRGKADRRTERDRARSDAQRGPAPRERPR